MPSWRAITLTAIVLACVALGVTYVALSAGGDAPSTKVVVARAAAPDAPAAKPASHADAARAVLVRAIDPRDRRLNGAVYRVALDRPERPARHASLSCERVAYAAGTGLCLAMDRSGVRYDARFFDARLRVRWSMPLTGLPSRARVSPDGRWAAMTTFTTGDSYAQPGQFSTRTKLIDVRARRIVADLEQFAVIRDGERVEAPDHNFWGVTFAADANRFYATLATGGRTHLVEGDVRARTLTIVHDNVECPSLSPDGTRIAYKKLVAPDGTWRFTVLDLATGAETPLAERRSIDDQLEWLDDDTLAFGDGTGVWTMAADGSGEVRKLLEGADSPVALRGSPRASGAFVG
jgi:hypothetical protein